MPELQASLKTITEEDLKDPRLVVLNNTLQFLGSQIAGLQGATGIIKLLGDVQGTKFFGDSAEIPDNPNELLSRGAADALYNPNVQRDAFVSKKWFGQEVKPLNLQQGGNTQSIPGAPSSADIPTNSHQREGAAKVTIVDLRIEGNTNVDLIREINVGAAAVDETDVGWNGQTSAMNNTDDPANITVNVLYTSRYGYRINGGVISNGGTGYTKNFLVTFTGGNGSNALAMAIVDRATGAVTSIQMKDYGFGYGSVPSIDFSKGDGTGAVGVGLLVDFCPGDYLLVNDPGSVEVIRILSIVGANYKVARAQLGTEIKTHGNNSYVYKLIPYTKSFPVMKGEFMVDFPTTPSGMKSRFEFLYDNKTVVSLMVQAITEAGPGPTLFQVQSSFGGDTPPAPGYRTYNGGTYTAGNLLDDPLVVGSYSDLRRQITEWNAIRVVTGTLRVAPTGDSVCYVVYIDPAGTHVGLIDILTFHAGSRFSYPLDGSLEYRQMPYHTGWTPPHQTGYSWPPQMFPELTGALDGSGMLQTGFTLDPASAIQFKRYGWIDFIFMSVTGTPYGACIDVHC